MPVKVFNQTFGRDEEKVFGENTNRGFESIEVPTVEEFETLQAAIQQLQSKSHELIQLQSVDTQALKSLADRMLDRQEAERIFAELKSALVDTSVFSKALFEALDSHEQRISHSNALMRDEVAGLQKQSQTSAAVMFADMDAFHNKTNAMVQSFSAKQAELKVMLALAQQAQADAQLHAKEITALKDLQKWADHINSGGFWKRLRWFASGKV